MKSSQPIKIKESSNTKPIIIPLLIILIITILTQLGSLAYSSSESEQSFQSVVLQSIVFLSLITIPLAGIGLWLGRKIDLGAKLLESFLQKQPDALNKLYKDAGIASVLGLLMGAVLILIRISTEPYLPAELPTFGHRGILGGLLVSAGAAVGEEVWFRLGLMTILLWIVTRIAGHEKIRASVAWPVIIIVSIGFGLGHLPQLMSYGAGSPFAVWGTILGNSMVGTLYGWCYWRRSLTAAVIAHFSVDLVIHVFPAIVA
jgi:hypothetical protein